MEIRNIQEILSTGIDDLMIRVMGWGGLMT